MKASKFYVKSNYIKNAKDNWIFCEGKLLYHENITFLHLKSLNSNGVISDSESNCTGFSTLSRMPQRQSRTKNKSSTLNVLCNLLEFKSCEIKSVNFKCVNKFAIKLVPSVFLSNKKLYLLPDLEESLTEWCGLLTGFITKTINYPINDSVLDSHNTMTRSVTNFTQKMKSTAFSKDVYISLDDNDAYETNDQNEFHMVFIEESEDSVKLHLQGNYILKLGLESLDLLNSASRDVIHTFPYSSIRRFGAKDTMLRLEAGRHCSTGSGSFTFQIKDAVHVAEKLKENARQIKNRKSVHSSCMTLDRPSLSQISLQMQTKRDSSLNSRRSSLVTMHTLNRRNNASSVTIRNDGCPMRTEGQESQSQDNALMISKQKHNSVEVKESIKDHIDRCNDYSDSGEYELINKINVHEENEVDINKDDITVIQSPVKVKDVSLNGTECLENNAKEVITGSELDVTDSLTVVEVAEDKIYLSDNGITTLRSPGISDVICVSGADCLVKDVVVSQHENGVNYTTSHGTGNDLDAIINVSEPCREDIVDYGSKSSIQYLAKISDLAIEISNVCGINSNSEEGLLTRLDDVEDNNENNLIMVANGHKTYPNNVTGECDLAQGENGDCLYNGVKGLRDSTESGDICDSRKESNTSVDENVKEIADNVIEVSQKTTEHYGNKANTDERDFTKPQEDVNNCENNENKSECCKSNVTTNINEKLQTRSLDDVDIEKMGIGDDNIVGDREEPMASAIHNIDLPKDPMNVISSSNSFSFESYDIEATESKHGARPSSLFESSVHRNSVQRSPSIPRFEKSTPHVLTDYKVSDSTFFKFRQVQKPPMQILPSLPICNFSQSSSRNTLKNNSSVTNQLSPKRTPPPILPKPTRKPTAEGLCQDGYREFDQMLKDLNLSKK